MTIPTAEQIVHQEHPPPAVLRWKSWPLVEHLRWSWSVPLGIVATGVTVAYVGGGWLLGGAVVAALAVACWQFLLPVEYEANPVGLCADAFGRRRLFEWQTIRSYQPRSTGVVLFMRADPTAIDALRSQFVPYGHDEDETLCAVKQYLQHAVELPA